MLVVYVLFSYSGSIMAYWVEKSDKDLITESSIIVYAQYLGSSVLSINGKGFPVNLGVLKSSKTLKGQENLSVIFIKLPDPDQPISSDMLFFKENQSGLWFLNSVQGTKGLYQITHPSQFKEISGQDSEIKRWQKLLKKN